MAPVDARAIDGWLIPHDEPPFIFTYVFSQALHDTFG
jgi:hypothetical protein